MEWLLLVGLVLLCALCMGGPFMFLRRVQNKRNRLRQLRAPLLDSEDHRLDAALRQAQGGFNVCAACGFDNFKRSTFCTLCGDEICDPTREIDPQRLKELKRQERKSSLRRILTLSFREKQEARVAVRMLEQEATRVRRQRRARNRREWTRKLDVQGRMFWYRNSTAGTGESSNPTTYFPGYVYEVHKKPVIVSPSVILAAAAALEASEMCPDANNTNANNINACSTNTTNKVDANTTTTTTTAEQTTRTSDVVVSEPRTAAERTASLREACEGVQYELVDAAHADPTRLPSVDSPLTLAQQKQLLALYQRDFPSKYAQFVTCSAALLVPADVAHLRLNVHRARVYEESVASFAVIHKQHLRSVMRINFVDESGVDAGGVHREWFAQFIEKIVEPTRGLFECVDRTEQTFYLNPHSQRDLGDHHLMHFFATGRLLGRALLEGYATGFHLALPLLKIMLGVPVSFSDLEFFDPEAYKNMVWMLENDGVDALGLDFSVTHRNADSSEVEIHDLIPNGREIAVTDANKREFLDRKFKYMLFESVADQLYALLSGVYEIIPQELLMMFDPEELDHVLCGSDEIDVDDWEKHTRVSDDLVDHAARKWFWELVREMPNEYRRRLLLFATGSSRVPLAGFSALTSYDGKLCLFSLKGVALVNDGYVVGHACFNSIDLPRHTSREDLKLVLYATLDTEQYGFTTD